MGINIKENKKYLIFTYQDINEINNLLNEWYKNNKLIILDKKENDITIKLEKDNYTLNKDQTTLDENLDKIIDLLEISNNIRINIKNNQIKLYTNNYQNIFDNLLLKENNYYILDIDKEKEIYYEMSKYNKYTNTTNNNNIVLIDSFNPIDIHNYINEKTDTIKIINGKDSIKLYINNDKNYLFNFQDKKMFNNIYLPEILKYYNKYNATENSNISKQFNKCYGNINDNFYLINFTEEEIDGCIFYLQEATKKKFEDEDLQENYTFIKNIESVSPSYSYGYVSIIFISFIISIVTIIIALINS